MSQLETVRAELYRSGRTPTPHLRLLATVTLLILAVVTGLAEVHMLPTYSADDFSSVLFGAG